MIGTVNTAEHHRLALLTRQSSWRPLKYHTSESDLERCIKIIMILFSQMSSFQSLRSRRKEGKTMSVERPGRFAFRRAERWERKARWKQSAWRRRRRALLCEPAALRITPRGNCLTLSGRWFRWLSGVWLQFAGVEKHSGQASGFKVYTNTKCVCVCVAPRISRNERGGLARA